MYLQFLDTFPALPASAPADHPHIIDIKTYIPPTGSLATTTRLQDAVATMLFHISAHTLTTLLAATPPVFQLVQKSRDPKKTDKLVIEKSGKHILVGVFTERVEEHIFEFDNLVRFTIDEGGSWNIVYVSYRDNFYGNCEAVWTTLPVDLGYGILRETARPGHDRKGRMNLFSWQLADTIMTGQL